MDGQDRQDKNQKHDRCSLFRAIAMSQNACRLRKVAMANLTTFIYMLSHSTSLEFIDVQPVIQQNTGFLE